MDFFKKTTHLIRISAALIFAVGIWVGLAGECLATVVLTTTDIGSSLYLGDSTFGSFTKLSNQYNYASSSILVGKVSFWMHKVNSPTDNVTVKIYGVGATPDAGTLLNTSLSVSGSTMSTDYSWVDFQFEDPIYLAASTNYYFVMERSGAVSSNSYQIANAQTGVSWITKRWYKTTTWDGDTSMDLAIAIDNENGLYQAAEISVTYPTSSSTSKAEYWTVDANTNDDTTYDKLYVKVRSASTEECAENTACTSAWVDGNKVIGECDGVDSTFDNTTNVSRLSNIPDSMDGETIYATAFLYGVTDATCVDGEGPEVPVLLATSSTISFTYSIDYITDLSDSDEYWAASWEEKWGAATSTVSYQAVAGSFDLVMGPVVNWASGWSHLFNTTDATAAGVSAGSGVQTLAQHAKDFFNIIPGCQLFSIVLIAIIIDIAIYIYKNIYRIKKFFTV